MAEMEESVQEHNQRTIQALDRMVTEIEGAKSLLLKCDYIIFPKQEYHERIQKIKLCIAGTIFFSIMVGFSLGMIIAGG